MRERTRVYGQCCVLGISDRISVRPPGRLQGDLSYQRDTHHTEGSVIARLFISEHGVGEGVAVTADTTVALQGETEIERQRHKETL